jgi:hypothetical protein
MGVPGGGIAGLAPQMGGQMGGFGQMLNQAVPQPGMAAPGQMPPTFAPTMPTQSPLFAALQQQAPNLPQGPAMPQAPQPQGGSLFAPRPQGGMGQGSKRPSGLGMGLASMLGGRR